MRRALLALVGASLACGGGATPVPEAPVDDPLAPVRTLVVARGAEDLGICDFENGWGYAALHALDATPDVRAAARAAEADPALAPLTSTDLFARWRDSRLAELDSDDALRAWLAAHPDWHETSSYGIARALTLAADGTFAVRRMGAEAPDHAGAWRVTDGKMVLTVDGADTAAPPHQGSWALELRLGALGTFEVDPLIGDC